MSYVNKQTNNLLIVAHKKLLPTKQICVSVLRPAYGNTAGVTRVTPILII